MYNILAREKSYSRIVVLRKRGFGLYEVRGSMR